MPTSGLGLVQGALRHVINGTQCVIHKMGAASIMLSLFHPAAFIAAHSHLLERALPLPLLCGHVSGSKLPKSAPTRDPARFRRPVEPLLHAKLGLVRSRLTEGEQKINQEETSSISRDLFKFVLWSVSWRVPQSREAVILKATCV